jgi:hypothetical protein
VALLVASMPKIRTPFVTKACTPLSKLPEPSVLTTKVPFPVWPGLLDVSPTLTASNGKSDPHLGKSVLQRLKPR